MKKTTLETKNEASQIDEEKRDFLFVTTAGLAVAGGAATAISLINTMNPAKDVLALSTTEVDLSPVEEEKPVTEEESETESEDSKTQKDVKEASEDKTETSENNDAENKKG